MRKSRFCWACVVALGLSMLSPAHAGGFGRRCHGGARAPKPVSCCVQLQSVCVAPSPVVVYRLPVAVGVVVTAAPVCTGSRCMQPIRKTAEVAGQVAHATGHVIRSTAQAAKTAFGAVLGDAGRCDTGHGQQ